MEFNKVEFSVHMLVSSRKGEVIPVPKRPSSYKKVMRTILFLSFRCFCENPGKICPHIYWPAYAAEISAGWSEEIVREVTGRVIYCL
jgi:hypothetical protein